MNDNYNERFEKEYEEAKELSLKIVRQLKNKPIVVMMALGLCVESVHASQYTGNAFTKALDDWYSVVRRGALEIYLTKKSEKK